MPEAEAVVAEAEEVLVLPRALFDGFDRVRPWRSITSVDLESHAQWVPRDLAEVSSDLIQPIPCAVLRNSASEICVFRRVRETRSDLRQRITLLVGGHVDRAHHSSLSALLRLTLRRELEEEVGLTKVGKVTPIGLVVDALSVEASRHVAFVYEVTVQQPLRTLAHEEFSARSKFSGRFFPPQDLEQFHNILDPWSLLLVEDIISPESARLPVRQLSLSFPIDV